MLEDMFILQKKLQKRLGVYAGSQQYINTMVLAIIDEAMEALRETPWKPWKEQQKFNENRFKEEIIDMWHFLINISLASGMDAQEVFYRFLEKNKENNKRQDEHY